MRSGPLTYKDVAALEPGNVILISNAHGEIVWLVMENSGQDLLLVCLETYAENHSILRPIRPTTSMVRESWCDNISSRNTFQVWK